MRVRPVILGRPISHPTFATFQRRSRSLRRKPGRMWKRVKPRPRVRLPARSRRSRARRVQSVPSSRSPISTATPTLRSASKLTDPEQAVGADRLMAQFSFGAEFHAMPRRVRPLFEVSHRRGIADCRRLGVFGCEYGERVVRTRGLCRDRRASGSVHRRETSRDRANRNRRWSNGEGKKAWREARHALRSLSAIDPRERPSRSALRRGLVRGFGFDFRRLLQDFRVASSRLWTRQPRHG